MRRPWALVLILVVALMSAACGSDDDGGSDASGGGQEGGGGDTYAIVLPSAYNDNSFSQVGYAGLTEGVKAIGGKSVYLDNVQVPDAEEAFRNLATRDGVKAVIGLGGQFADAGAAVAPEFPDVHFIVINGTKTADNLSRWSLAEGEVAYLAGMLTAATLQPAPDKLGRVAGIEIPPLKFSTAGFIDGARTVNPKIGYFSTFTGDMDDVAKAKEASLAAYRDGADVLYVGTNNGMTGQEQAAKEAGKLLVNNVIDKCSDPDAGSVYYATAITDPSFAVKSVVTGIDGGTLKPGFSRSNLEEQEGYLIKLCKGEIPPEVQTKLDEARGKLNKAEIKIGLEPAA